ncbi:DUF5359 family protein [Anaerobacillus sp. MEB173]|uniref:DUF5359 family protein n=1 Tax=Anaerobacillus sp. MEB173 TaxID=3383345 RepID=UPI003F9107EA
MKKQEYINKIEKFILKLLIIHLLFLVLSQFLVQEEDIKPYVSKTVQYEGVFNQSLEKHWKH